jgi:NAD(P)-dependent dehydrogenase (short-subunit alcohol dehydrogenase family)
MTEQTSPREPPTADSDPESVDCARSQEGVVADRLRATRGHLTDAAPSRAAALAGSRADLASLTNRTVLVTGGAGATGIETVLQLHARGATVVIGTRSQHRYRYAAELLGEERVEPFIADLTQREDIVSRLDDLRGKGVLVTDVVHSAAGGLEPLVRDLMRWLTSLRRLTGTDRDERLRRFRNEMPALVDKSRAYAMQINVEGPITLCKSLAESMPPGGTVTFYTSLWGSLYGSVDVPTFYDGVARSKHAFEAWLEAYAPAWVARGLAVAVVSGHIVKDTPVGSVIDRYMTPLLPDDRQQPARSYFLTTSDMVRPAVQLLEDAVRHARPRFIHVFVPGPGQVVTHLDGSSPALSDPFPL